MDAGFIHVVEFGQYFMTKDNGENSMRRLVVNILFQEMTDRHNQKNRSREAQNWTRTGSYDQLLVW